MCAQPAPATGVDVLHIAYGGLGGHAPVVTTLTKPLSILGLRSGVITYADGAALNENASAWASLPVVHPIEMKGRVDFSAWKQIHRLVRELRPRVVLLHTLKFALPVKAALQGIRGIRSPCLLIEHQPIDLRSGSDNILSALSLPLVKAVVYLSDDYQQRYPFRHFPFPSIYRAVIIPNGVDTKEFSPRSQPLPATEFRIGMASRLTGTKDLPTLISAIHELRTAYSGQPVRLEVAGAGPLLSDLRSLADRLQVQSHVSFVGHIPSDGLADFYRGLDAYVQSTHGETASTAILQAMATGLPVIGSDVYGVNDLVQHDRTGLLVPPQDPRAMAQTISNLQSDEALRTRLGAAGRADVLSRFSADGAASAYRQLFARIDPSGPWAGRQDHAMDRVDE
jgi:glycosyltransferase involved in cell wall biosynthesis